MRMQILHQLLKRDLLPDPCSTVRYPSCTLESTFGDIDVLQSLNFSATQELLASEDTMKHKVIYIASYIAKNHPQVDNDEESISSTFLDELNRGSLTVLTLRNPSPERNYIDRHAVSNIPGESFNFDSSSSCEKTCLLVDCYLTFF